jgi:hypothetical protein
MKKRPDCDDNRNISVVICDTDTPNHCGDRKTFEVMFSSLGTLDSKASMLAANPIKEIMIGSTSSGISDILVSKCGLY